MEADWEVEIGGGAAVIEAEWPGWIDLRKQPERASEIAEAAGFAALGKLLRALNGPESPWWTSKCDLWQEETGELACYVDLLPLEGRVFAEWQQAESFCRAYVALLAGAGLPEHGARADDLETSVDLVIRAAVAGEAEGFGITAYLSAGSTADGAAALAAAMDAFADAVALVASPAEGSSKLQ